MERGIPSGSECLRELVATMVDPIFQVPLVCIVEVTFLNKIFSLYIFEIKNVPQHWFNKNRGNQHQPFRIGSLHHFVQQSTTLESANCDISAEEVHKMGNTLDEL